MQNRLRGIGRMLSSGIGAWGAGMPAVVWAQQGPAAAPAREGETLALFVWGLSLAAAIAALVFAFRFFKAMMASDEGSPRMVEIAGYVRQGANAYLKQQYVVVCAFFVVIVLLLSLAAYNELQSPWVPFAFLTGGFFSGLAGWFGMKTATWASSRTAAGAQKSLNDGLQVAFRSGAVMGLTVVGLGLLDICLWFGILRWGARQPLQDITVTMLCFGMGASSQALFARVGGGIFTKAADVGADLVGKIEQGIPEDDPRNPATIADNVGDNVGDVAGMGADLYESYCGSVLATAALGVAAFANPQILSEVVGSSAAAVESAQLRAMLLPMAIAAAGIVVSIYGIFMVRTQEDATQKTLLKALARGIDLSTGLVVVAAVVLTWLLMPRTEGTMYLYFIPGVSISIIVGLAAGWLIGKWTEYSTSDEYAPTKQLAAQAETGPATLIIGGMADGMLSVWAPVVIVCVATVCAFGFANGWRFDDVGRFSLGLYGVGIAAVGMLSTLGITLATDAYGPIADNAGGNAEMSHLEPIVRQRTDALDSLGNTTAATGKGFAIGSAALTALALLAAYVEEVRVGFERWGNAVVTDERLELEAGNFYKVSAGFVVYAYHDPDRGAADPAVPPGGTGLAAATYLVERSDAQDSKLIQPWKELDASGGPVAIPAEMFTLDGPRNLDRPPASVRFAATNGPLMAVQSAALPDFSRYYDLSVLNPKVLVGMFLGAMSTFLFCALTMKAVGRAAKGMVEEVRRQFREKPGIMQNTETPDYARPVAISTRAAQREMIFPSALGLSLPVIVGLLLGVAGVMGLLVGTLTTGFCVAVFMANAGGSWDNAKKYIEAGHFGGKGSSAHKAGVVGDTVGDPFKDTSGPSLNILIKLMSMVSVVAAGFVVRYSLVAMGIF